MKLKESTNEIFPLAALQRGAQQYFCDIVLSTVLGYSVGNVLLRIDLTRLKPTVKVGVEQVNLSKISSPGADVTNKY